MNATARRSRDIRDLLSDAASLSIDQLPMLPVIFDRIGHNLAERLRALATAIPHFTVNSIDSARIGDVLDTYEMRAVVGVMHVPAWDNRVIVGLDRDFVFTMMEMLFGGDGSEPPWEEERGLSNVEVQVCHFVFDQIAQALQSGFSLVTNARFRFERCETRMDFAGAGRRGSPAVVARFILQAINRGGEMFVIVPQAALSPLRQALARIVSREAAAADPAWVRQIADEVQRTEVTIRAVIESRDYTLDDLAGLQVGQVLKLPATTRSRVKVESNEQPLFWSYLGQHDGYHTLSIDQAIDHEREFLNDVLPR
jgi:flagellar motor switch protein FliM